MDQFTAHPRPYQDREQNLYQMGFHSYSSYLLSPLWMSIRRAVMYREGNRCQCCWNNRATQVHHLDYEPITLRGARLMSLVAVCRSCHKAAEFDGKRKRTPSEANAVIVEMASKKFTATSPKYRQGLVERTALISRRLGAVIPQDRCSAVFVAGFINRLRKARMNYESQRGSIRR